MTNDFGKEILMRVLQPDFLGVMIPILAILMCGTIAIVAMVIKHRERIAKIEHGIDPDEKNSRDK